MNTLVLNLALIICIILFACKTIMKLLDDRETFVSLEKIDGPLKWNRNQCNYLMGETLSKVLTDSNINKTDKEDWNVLFPCTYDNLDSEINKLKLKENDVQQRVFIVNNADEICAKNLLWKNLVNYFGRNDATKYMPMTYVLSNDDEMKLFDKEYKQNKLYILKKNIQRQEGLLISNKYDEIINAKKDNYVIAQELLQNPYILNTRKINMRFYILIVCQKNDMQCYVYNDGFMYYTKDPFVKNSLKSSTNITTGYIDREVYKTNPLTHADFKIWLDNSERNLSPIESEYLNNNPDKLLSEHVFDRIYYTIKQVFFALRPKIMSDSKLKNTTSYELFGADIAPNDILESQIMEINKGPNLEKMDDTDGKLKYGVHKDALAVLQFESDGKAENYIKLFETNENEIIEEKLNL